MPVQIVGLRELQRDLKSMDSRLDKDVRRALKQAADVVARSAAEKVPIGPGKLGFHAKNTLKGGSTSTGAFVVGGKESVPYFGWLDFGSRHPRKTSEHTNQTVAGRRAIARMTSGRRVGPWANSGKGPHGGRFIYPSIEEKSPEVVRIVDRAVGAAQKAANL